MNFAVRMCGRRFSFMTSLAWRAAILGIAAATNACGPATEAPTAESAAAYLGLSVGATFNYDAGGGLGETHTIQESSVLVPDALVFDVVARTSSGFPVPERTFSVAVDAKSAHIVRFSDCVTSCRQPATPVAFIDVPLRGGASSESEAEVTVTDNTGMQTVVSERHVFVVSEAADLTVPAGTFPAHAVAWTRVRDGAPESAVLQLVADKGIVSWDGFDGAALRLAE